MATRRHFLRFTGLFVAGATLARAEDLCAVSTQETQAATSADQALRRLADTQLIVVLGHSECGAIKGAVDDVKLGNLTAMLANIRPSILKVAVGEGDPTSKNKKFVQSVADQNARDGASLLTERSEVLAALAREHRLKIVSAMHDVSTGAVRWLES